MSFFRTVLGDLPTSLAGLVYSHEHLWLDSPRLREGHPELLLNDQEKIQEEISGLVEMGVLTFVDAMPLRSGRDGRKLEEISRATGANIIASTGIHLDTYYNQEDPILRETREDLSERFWEEIEGMLEECVPETGGITSPQPPRAGCIKLASGGATLSPMEVERFAAGALAQAQTGCPILTHTERGEAALEQVEVLLDHGAVPESVVLSHLDRKPDVAYHKEVLETGVTLEYDSCFRWNKDRGDLAGYGPEPGKNPTLDLLVELLPAYPSQFVVGMDAAKSTIWSSFGGKPGLTFLVQHFVTLLTQRGIPAELSQRLFDENPKRAFRFRPRPQATQEPTE